MLCTVPQDHRRDACARDQGTGLGSVRDNRRHSAKGRPRWSRRCARARMGRRASPHIGFAFDHVLSVAAAGYFKPHARTYARAAESIAVDRTASCLSPTTPSVASAPRLSAGARPSSIGAGGRFPRPGSSPISSSSQRSCLQEAIEGRRAVPRCTGARFFWARAQATPSFFCSELEEVVY